MKYKIKFEINYGDLETDELRDCKLDLLNQEITTEIESEFPLSMPDKEDSIRLGDEFYKINGKYHQLEKDCYTTTINVTSEKVLSIITRVRCLSCGRSYFAKRKSQKNVFEF